MCKFLLADCMHIICKNVYAKLVQSFFFMSLAFQKAKSYQNLTNESGSKQRFSLLQEIVVIQAPVPEDSGS